MRFSAPILALLVATDMAAGAKAAMSKDDDVRALRGSTNNGVKLPSTGRRVLRPGQNNFHRSLFRTDCTCSDSCESQQASCGCWCDSLCKAYNDCCDDVETVCDLTFEDVDFDFGDGGDFVPLPAPANPGSFSPIADGDFPDIDFPDVDIDVNVPGPAPQAAP